MDCVSDEKMIDFLTDEVREEFMSKDEVEVIRLHISQCDRCQKKMKEYLKLLGKLHSVEFKRIVERERRMN